MKTIIAFISLFSIGLAAPLNLEKDIQEIKLFIEKHSKKEFSKKIDWKFTTREELVKVHYAEIMDRTVFIQQNKIKFYLKNKDNFHKQTPDNFLNKYQQDFEEYLANEALLFSKKYSKGGHGKFSWLFGKIYFNKYILEQYKEKEPETYYYLLTTRLVSVMQAQNFNIHARHHFSSNPLDDNLYLLIMDGESIYLGLKFLEHKGFHKYIKTIKDGWKKGEFLAYSLYQGGYDLMKHYYENKKLDYRDFVMNVKLETLDRSYFSDSEKLIKKIEEQYLAFQKIRAKRKKIK